jgi:hypothetical protein
MYKQMLKKYPRYERPISYHKLNFPAQFFCQNFPSILCNLGRFYLGHLFPHFFTLQSLILLLAFRFLWLGLGLDLRLSWRRTAFYRRREVRASLFY